MTPLRRFPAALLFGFAAACSDATEPAPTPTTVHFAAPAVALDDGSTVQLSATVSDQKGQPLAGPTGALRWVSADPAIATVDGAGLVSALRPGSTRITATAGSASASVEVTVRAVASALQPIVGLNLAGTAGAALADSVGVRVVDRHGNGVGGVAVQFAVATGGGSVSTATVATRPDGTAKVQWTLGTTAGAHALQATTGSLAPVTLSAVARAGAPARVEKLRGDNQATTVRTELPETLVVRVVDGYGNPVAGAGIEWVVTAGGGSITRLAPATDAEGLARARWALGGTAGSNAVAASVSGLAPAGFTASATATTVPNPPQPATVAVNSVSPAVLVPGGSATIAGSGFGAGPVSVTIDGVAAMVTATSATQLSVALPPANAFRCEPTRPVEVVVTVAGAAGTRAHPLAVARQRTLRPGESLMLLDAAEVRCNELAAGGGRYVVSVFNTSTALSASTAFQLRGAAEGAAAQAVAAEPFAALLASGAPRTFSRQPATGGLSFPELEADEAAHLAQLEANRELMLRLGSSQRVQPSRRGSLALSRVAPPAVGDTVPFRYHNASCGATATPVRARVVYVGAKSVVYEDVENPLAGTIDESYRRLGAEFEAVQLPILERNFGNPLAMDPYLNNDGRIAMLFTRQLNDRRPGIAGFVWSGDMVSTAQCANSNLADIFYGFVPLTTTAVAGWERSITGTMGHEVKHITSFAERLSRQARVFEESWLEESTARIFEELWIRAKNGTVQNGNAGYAQSIYCEVRPSFPECAGKAFAAMQKHFGGLYDYLKSSETLTPIGAAQTGDFSFYGSGWSLVRWSLDHSGRAEDAFLKALTQETQLSGIANLSARAGRPWNEMLGEWALTLAVDDLPGFTPANPRLRMPSWNLRDIFAGMNRDFPSNWSLVYPLTPRPISYGAFAVEVPALRAGSAASFELSGTQAGKQLLDLRGAGGTGEPGATLRLSVLRVQ